MAEGSDGGQKTEDPSQRRLQRARSEGQIAQSREINTWFMLSATALLLYFMAPALARHLAIDLAVFVEPTRFILADGIAWKSVGAVLGRAAATVVAPFLLLMAAALAGSVVQTGFIFTVEKLGFDLSRLSPGGGLQRLFSLRSFMEMAKSIAKLAVVGGVAALMMRGEVARLPLLASLSVETMMGHVLQMVLRLLLGVIIALSVLAGSDYLFQRLQLLRSLRMTKQEVKEEQKQSEGDPIIRARLRQIRLDRARKRMMAAVPKASVVITNPTHFAVALRYDMGERGAPRLVAKGADLIALRIREVAEENGVPIVENPPLARALHAGVELDREIPPEHYKAVAEIIGYVFRLKGKLKPRPTA